MSNETNSANDLGKDTVEDQATDSIVNETAETEQGQEATQEGKHRAETSDQTSDEVELTDSGSLHEELQQQLEKAREDVLRAAAEAQNARRRADQEVEKARKFALERFVTDLLPVVDNLERAINSIDTEDEAMKSVYEGIELTYKSFQESLGRHQVVVIDPAGEPFNPELHQAMSMVPNPDAEPNTVIEVFQKDYKLSGRLVRPAMVVVSKSAE